MGRILQLIEEKIKTSRQIEKLLNRQSLDRAIADHHSRRKPRPCGITIHTGIGCSLRCAYCYIYDMGFPAQVKPYPLSGLELTYALSRNPYVLPKRTFAAYGSVTEPFLQETREKALEFIGTVFRWLRLPSQVSTKTIIDETLARELAQAEPRISILISLTTIRMATALEPLAPSPVERIKGVKTATSYGIATYIFIRPIIPGVTNKELEALVELAAEAGARGIVLGSLRITKSIVQRIASKGIPVHEILSRAPGTPDKYRQIPIQVDDIIKKAESIALDYGIKVFRTACMANVDSHGEFCFMCSLGPCGRKDRSDTIEYNDIAEYLEHLGLKARSIDMDSNIIKIEICDAEKKYEISKAMEVLKQATRRRILLFRSR
uniref:Radical SAM protein n=1 Tax=Ignisphaera aggregans TaxID=334771 RepID=A0A7C2VM30_9CREN